jgi:trans-aconitate methyltransferase
VHDVPFDTEKMWPDHGYLPHYLRIAADIGMAARVLELGVRRGDSLRLWQVLFPQGDVAGVDCDPAATWPPGTTRIEARQDHPDLPELAGARDLIVDDASHEAGPTMAAFTNLWPNVAPGGYYVIEDWWFNWHQKDSMLVLAQNLLPVLQQKEVASITYTWGLIIIRKT